MPETEWHPSKASFRVFIHLTWVEVNWSEIKLSFIPIHSNTYGLKWNTCI